MKKIILLIAIVLITMTAKSQIVINTVTATATGSYYLQPKAGVITAGSVIFSTSSNYNGTTGTIAVYVSDDAGATMSTKTWVPFKQTDAGAAIVYTLAAGENHYELRLFGIAHAWYKFVFTAGNGTVGTLKGVAFIQ